MDFKSKLLERVFAYYGYSFTDKEIKFGKIIQISVLIIGILYFIQPAMFVVKHGSIDSSSAGAFFFAIIACQSFCKIMSVFLHQQELKKVRSEIESIYDQISLKHRLVYKNDFQTYRRVVNSMFIGTFTSCSVNFIAVPVIRDLVEYLSEQKITKSFTFHFWFPFDPLDYYVPVRIYNLILVLGAANCVTSLEGYVMLTFGQLTVLFKSLAEDIVDIINDYEENGSQLTEKHLIEKIEIHTRLIDVTKEIAEVYEIALLCHIMCFAGSTCFILLKTFVVDSGQDVYTSIMSVVNMSGYFYYICYFGEQILEGVSETLRDLI